MVCHCAECCYADLSSLCMIMLSVVMMYVIMLSVVAPIKRFITLTSGLQECDGQNEKGERKGGRASRKTSAGYLPLWQCDQIGRNFTI
jgi:hypothetical protein